MFLSRVWQIAEAGRQKMPIWPGAETEGTGLQKRVLCADGGFLDSCHSRAGAAANEILAQVCSQAKHLQEIVAKASAFFMVARSMGPA